MRNKKFKNSIIDYIYFLPTLLIFIIFKSLFNKLPLRFTLFYQFIFVRLTSIFATTKA